MRRVSEKGIDLIKSFEALKTASYLDAVGMPTIGYGHVKGVEMGLLINEALANQLLDWDLLEVEREVNRFLPDGVSQGCFDAYCSLAFNVGWPAVERSRSMAHLHEYMESKSQESLKKAVNEFRDFCGANGQVLPGLVRRRIAEIGHWLGQQ